MIAVDRARLTAAGLPIEPGGTWPTRAQTQTTQAISDGPTHVVSDLYRDAAVKSALEELFEDKCAYCESAIVAGFSWDVEHFRPKGSVAEAPKHNGYYWLAYTWANLYPSCAFCNQRRKDQPTFADPTTGAATGKLNKFPLVDETKRALGPADALGNEEPKILDPCIDAPDQHLTFNAAGVISAKAGSIRGAATVSVFGLNRRRLVRQRLTMLRQLARQINALVSAGLSQQTVTDVVLAANSASDHPYSGMVAAARDDPPAFGF